MNILINETKKITYVMVDTDGTEVAGLGTGCTVQISKNGAAFGASAGTKAEIGSGWYSYVFAAAETDTLGPLAVKITGAGAVQQNILYEVVSVDWSSILAAIWAYSTRTVTQTAAQVVAALAGGEINIYRDSKTTISLTGLGSLAGRTKLYFTIKKAQSLADADSLSIMQIKETGGLLYLNAAAPVSPVIAADCSMTVTDEATGAVTIVIKMRPAASLTEISGLAYSLKMITSADDDGRNVTTGTANILASSTRSVT